MNKNAFVSGAADALDAPQNMFGMVEAEPALDAEHRAGVAAIFGVAPLSEAAVVAVRRAAALREHIHLAVNDDGVEIVVHCLYFDFSVEKGADANLTLCLFDVLNGSGEIAIFQLAAYAASVIFDSHIYFAPDSKKWSEHNLALIAP